MSRINQARGVAFNNCLALPKRGMIQSRNVLHYPIEGRDNPQMSCTTQNEGWDSPKMSCTTQVGAGQSMIASHYPNEGGRIHECLVLSKCGVGQSKNVLLYPGEWRDNPRMFCTTQARGWILTPHKRGQDNPQISYTVYCTSEGWKHGTVLLWTFNNVCH